MHCSGAGMYIHTQCMPLLPVLPVCLRRTDPLQHFCIPRSISNDFSSRNIRILWPPYATQAFHVYRTEILACWNAGNLNVIWVYDALHLQFLDPCSPPQASVAVSEWTRSTLHHSGDLLLLSRPFSPRCHLDSASRRLVGAKGGWPQCLLNVIADVPRRHHRAWPLLLARLLATNDNDISQCAVVLLGCQDSQCPGTTELTH